MEEVTKDTLLKFEISVEEANILIAALQELPAKIANPLTQKIQQQARQQLGNSVAKSDGETTY